ncbi:unnamed protein product [Didymodactylos carnosus]|uniref:G-protein coupled receptors family 1 profile domain-containing protein n=1 Tax=Didymodactylos carnosus TaxID=1234261 RepID=A0A815BHI0_9BILA|nr:unnamed protein product [Didymodactylos carnosus]CAF1269608.1 unnamed protein product [Didymodactylos carnosus]CAF3924182.1 unnamed protein product [Didymodactylos carnosus]CAF4056331.1 unnamed protein product [Didymodactylos carnosus]
MNSSSPFLNSSNSSALPSFFYSSSGLLFVYNAFSLYTQPLIIVLGTIGCVLNIVILTQKPLCSSSCAFYFRCVSINDLFVIYFIALLQWLSDQYEIDPTTYSQFYCKTQNYFVFIFYTLGRYFTVLACADRFCTSSPNSRLRKVAKLQIAYYSTALTVIINLIVYSHVLLNYTIISVPSSFGSVCTPGSTMRDYQFSALFVLIYLCFLPPALMCLFCLLTIWNIIQQGQRVTSIGDTSSIRRRKREQELVKMLFVFVITNLLFTLPYACVYLYVIYNPYLPIEFRYTLNLCHLIVNFNSASSFYVYTMSTRGYRNEVLKMIEKVKTIIQFRR